MSFPTDKILKRFNKGLLTEAILIDLQKAFDTVDYENLPQKLKAIRFSKGTIPWFRFYLSDQIFLVNIESKLSDFGKISCWVSQESILFPLMFLVYVKDMPQAVNLTLLLYADDSCILHQHKEVDEIGKKA